MTSAPLRLRLCGAVALRERQLVQRTVAIEGGRISAGPFPAVDLSGYLILPGIVDPLCQSMPGKTQSLNPSDTLHWAAQDLAQAGITTAWIARMAPLTQDQASAVSTCLTAHRGNDYACDLRPALIAERLMASHSDALLDLIKSHGISLVVFQDTLNRHLEQAQTRPEAFADWAQSQGQPAETLRSVLSAANENRARIPRALCKLAEAFDSSGIHYGSLGDPDGETRETWSMLGAKLCFAPHSKAAASVAQAVGNPVIAPASDVLPQPGAKLPGTRLLQTGRCQALSSGGHPAALVHAALSLEQRGVFDLPQAWRLVSENPADIMGLPDRGTIAPGKRADLVIMNAQTKRIEATISNGRIAYLAGQAAIRFMHVDAPFALAAE